MPPPTIFAPVLAVKTTISSTRLTSLQVLWTLSVEDTPQSPSPAKMGKDKYQHSPSKDGYHKWT